MRHIKQISCFGMLLCGAFSVIAAPSANDGASGIKAQIAAERKGSAKVFEEALAATEAKVWKSTDGKTLPYRLHLPAKPERGRLYPLVVHMHGVGAWGTNNLDQIKTGGAYFISWAKRHGEEYVFIAPQTPRRCKWVDTQWENPKSTMKKTPTPSLRMAMEIIDDAIARYPVDRDRVYLMGISMGGYAAWELLQRRPELFAAGLPCCGGGDMAQAPRLTDIPIWAFHGSNDKVVPVCRSRDMVAAIKAAGGKKILYREYKGLGHNVWTPTFSDDSVFKWLFSQKRQTHAAFAKTPEEVPKEHRYPDAAQGGHLLVLQCGSDWCESGEDVRKVFESATFRDALGSGWEFAVYDDMDAPTPDVKAANEPLSKLRVESKRFPAITCLTPEPRRFFAQLENIPFDVTAKALAAQVAAATSAKDEAVRLFGMAKASGDAAKAADAYGEAFALLSAQVGEFNGKSLREGGLAFADEWKALVKLDEGDRFGWKLRFEAGTGIDWIEKATKFRTDGDLVGGAAFVADLRAIPTNHLSVVQRQALDIAEYALWRKDVLRKTSNAAHLRHALSLGRDTVWGQCALGYLILSGEKFEKRGRYRAPVRPRPADVVGETPGFPLAKTEARVAAIKPGGGFSEDDKLAIAQYAVLRRIGKDAWDALNARPGAAAFVKEFFGDRAWMEDFAWSGACTDWPKAILALESIVYQDGGRWIAGDGAGRRFATALALTHHGRDEAWLADLLDAYRSTALAKRLHLSAKSQPVWLWRFALLHTAGCSRPASVEGSFDLGSEAAEQQRFLDAYFNAPFAKYAGACWLVPYRSDNCFGENVHTPFYYESWRAADEWILRRYSPTVGGVCGELSKFGSGCSNAHGLPSAPVSQPRHCAYVRRRLDGTWEIDNSVGRGTGFETVVPEHGCGTFTYCQAHEGTFSGDRERRHDADRLLEAAFFAEKSGRAPEDVAALFASACDAWPTHYCAWRLRGEWIARAARPLEGHRAFADSCAEALKGWRQPLWDILTLYFERVNKERGAAALADELVRMMPALRQGEDKMQEEGFFDSALARWTKPIGKDAALTERVAVAALEAQAGTKDYFAQTLSWCADFMIADAGRFGRLAELLGRLSGGNGQNIDFGRIILAASKAGNFAAFRQMAELQSKVSPLKREGKGYPEKDFGGVLVSADAMLRTSSTSRWDWPASYPLGLDALPLSGNAFHTDKEKEPWAMVVLAGECRVRGVLVANPGGYRGRQPPIEVQLSGDGKEWRTVFSDDAVRTEYRVDLGDKSVVAKFVRVRRVPGAREDFFHLNKILVYGDRMY